MEASLLHSVIGAFIGSIGFALLVHAPRRSLLPSGIIAALSYLVYCLLVSAGFSDAGSVFIGALVGCLCGQWVARRIKMISTIFIMSAIVPVVPGLGLYRMMALLGQGATASGVDQGIQAMITIAMIALGIGVGSFIDRQLHAGKHPSA